MGLQVITSRTRLGEVLHRPTDEAEDLKSIPVKSSVASFAFESHVPQGPREPAASPLENKALLNPCSVERHLSLFIKASLALVAAAQASNPELYWNRPIVPQG